MKSIKPGRGPSMMRGFTSLISAGFGVIWTLLAASMGAPPLFCLFGVLFIALGIGQAIYQFKNARQKNRYSSFDITDENEEPDPFNERFHSSSEDAAQEEDYDPNGGTNFCPYCGEKTGPEYAFCPNCGRKLPS